MWKGLNVLVSNFKCFPTAAVHERHPPPPNALSIFQNFNSLYDDDDANYYSDDDHQSLPDFSSAFASDRFFFSSPGSSNSIIIEPPPEDSSAVVSGGVALQTYSPDPYSDFRKSMMEMIESRGLTDVGEDWEILHELLVCYLKLNPKHTHKFIVRAFADVVVSLVTASAFRRRGKLQD